MMKRILKSIAAFFLGIAAQGVLRRYRPKVLMVTGSVGKTSTKDAIAAVLASRFFLWKSEKSYNSELGVPFTVLGVKNPWGDPISWILLLKRALALLILPNHYPNLLVLEVGADRPGDLARILRFVTPDAVVVTRLPEIPVHVEAYPSPDAVREEEFAPAHALVNGAPLILCTDDPYARMLAKQTPATCFTYGESADAQVRVLDIGFSEEGAQVIGMRARVESGEESGELVVKGSVGKTQILPAAAALSAAAAFGVPLSEAIEALKAYEPPAGRGRLFAGKNGAVLIDDTYNSSPAAVEEALATLARFPHAKHRIAVLGDMLELGRYSVTEHARIGELAGKAADIVIAVGIRSKAVADAAKGAETHSFENSAEAAKALPALVSAGDVVLIKGSQSIRTERITEELLANREDVSRLVRQESEWKRRA